MRNTIVKKYAYVVFALIAVFAVTAWSAAGKTQTRDYGNSMYSIELGASVHEHGETCADGHGVEVVAMNTSSADGSTAGYKYGCDRCFCSGFVASSTYSTYCVCGHNRSWHSR
jgi:hypothetical protein